MAQQCTLLLAKASLPWALALFLPVNLSLLPPVLETLQLSNCCSAYFISISFLFTAPWKDWHWNILFPSYSLLHLSCVLAAVFSWAWSGWYPGSFFLSFLRTKKDDWSICLRLVGCFAFFKAKIARLLHFLNMPLHQISLPVIWLVGKGERKALHTECILIIHNSLNVQSRRLGLRM